MRRMAALAALGALLLAAGCSGDDSTDGVHSPAASSSAAAPVPAGAPPGAPSVAAGLNGHNQQICDQAALARADFGDTYIADLNLRSTAKGAAAKTQAQQKIARDVQGYSSALAGMAKVATDPALKKALTRMSEEVTALKGDVAKINAEKMSALSATLDGACRKGF